MPTKPDASALADLSAQIVAAYVSKNTLTPADLPDLIVEVHAALAGLGSPAEPEQAPLTPAVPVRRSVQPNAITCLECGRMFRSMKRHLATQHELTPEDYRERWNLAPNYPMVTSNYSELRSRAAKASGLGQKAAKKASRDRER